MKVFKRKKEGDYLYLQSKTWVHGYDLKHTTDINHAFVALTLPFDARKFRDEYESIEVEKTITVKIIGAKNESP